MTWFIESIQLIGVCPAAAFHRIRLGGVVLFAAWLGFLRCLVVWMSSFLFFGDPKLGVVRLVSLENHKGAWTSSSVWLKDAFGTK